MVTDGNQTNQGDHFEMYRNIKSLHCVTGTNSVEGQLHFKNKAKSREKIRDYQKQGMEIG